MENASNDSPPDPTEDLAVIEQERQRIGRDLHDGVAQQIAFVLYKLEFTQRLMEQHQFQVANQEIQKAATILEECLRELYASINALRPPQLEQRNLLEAITDLLKQYGSNNPGLSIHQHLQAAQRVPESLEIPIFRLLQEALANIYQHAHASAIWIEIDVHNDQLILTIKDNGDGFSTQNLNMPTARKGGQAAPAASHNHLGLHTMRERVQEAGGSWQLHSQPGTGTTITASFPLSHPDTIA